MRGPGLVEQTLVGGLPALTIGDGTPLVWLGGSTPNHRNPKPGLERTFVVGPLLPYVGHDRAVTLVGRWPGMRVGTTFAEVAARHADALAARFEGPVDVVGVSTGGSVLLQLLVDRPEVVRRAVVVSSAYALGPLGRRVQLELVRGLERDGRYPASAVLDLLVPPHAPALVRRLVGPLAWAAARRLTVDDPGDTVAMLLAEDGFDVGDQLDQVGVPTLVATGGRDPFWPPEMFAETARRLPRGELHVEPRAGHAPVSNARVRARVLDFLGRAVATG